MRLLDVATLKLKSFGDPDQVNEGYAILSHVWTDEEVTFQELNRDHSEVQGRKGWQKILGLCAKARSEGFRYAWIDTCCIDKTSSAELAEAINSMLLWYQNATVTKIDRGAFGRLSWEDFSIAAIMSWASSRETTRIEDQAYSLMGIFNVNMPLIYGEGCKAFYRLQVEIMKSTNDTSLFVWTTRQFRVPSFAGLGLLAPAPRFFRDSHSITKSGSKFNQEHPYDMEKQYIRLSTTVVRLCETTSPARFAKSGHKNRELVLLGSLQVPRNPESPEFNDGENGRLVLTSWADPVPHGLRERCLLAVLQCNDGDGNIAIPIQEQRTGEYKRMIVSHRSGWYRVKLTPLILASTFTENEPRGKFSYEFPHADSRSDIPKRTGWLRPYTLRINAYSSRWTTQLMVGSNEPKFYRQNPTRLFRSLPVEDEEYRLTMADPSDFILTSWGDAPTVYEVTQQANESMSFRSKLSLTFEPRTSKTLPPFAIVVEKEALAFNMMYRITCHVDFSAGSEPPNTVVSDVLASNPCTVVPLAGIRCLVFRVRQHRYWNPGCGEFSVTIETRPVWDLEKENPVAQGEHPE